MHHCVADALLTGHELYDRLGRRAATRQKAYHALFRPALGFVNAMKDLPDKTTLGGMLYVFGLPGAGTAPQRGDSARRP